VSFYYYLPYGLPCAASLVNHPPLGPGLSGLIHKEAGRHSIRTNQRPTSVIPFIFTPNALPVATLPLYPGSGTGTKYAVLHTHCSVVIISLRTVLYIRRIVYAKDGTIYDAQTVRHIRHLLTPEVAQTSAT